MSLDKTLDRPALKYGIRGGEIVVRSGRAVVRGSAASVTSR